MEKVLFIDWGTSGREPTKARLIRLEGDGFLQEAKFGQQYVFNGDYESQCYELSVLINRIKPDRLIMDFGAVGPGLLRFLQERLGYFGVREKSQEEMPIYKPPRDYMMGRM